MRVQSLARNLLKIMTIVNLVLFFFFLKENLKLERNTCSCDCPSAESNPSSMESYNGTLIKEILRKPSYYNVSDMICSALGLGAGELLHEENKRIRDRRMSRVECSPENAARLYYCGIPFYKMVYLTPTYQCAREIHIGDWGEGGKWICDCPCIPQNTSVVYSIGSGGIKDFEDGMYEKFNSEIHTFDPTLLDHEMQMVTVAQHIHFYEIGLSSSENPVTDLDLYREKNYHLSSNAKFMKIDEIMKMLNHEFVDVFKLDCEGCEEKFIPFLANITTRNKPLFGQMLIEFHRIEVEHLLTRKLFNQIESLGYRLFHAEPNFFDASNCWELAYIHESILSRSII